MKSPLGRLTFATPPHFQDKLADLIRQEKPNIVVETGVWEGLSTEYILKALDDNGRGHLWSIDPMDAKQQFNGVSGRPELFDDNPIEHPRWTLIRKRSQDALELLFADIGPFDFFLHDSDHSAECQEYEFESAWRMVRPGGIIASDDCFWGEPPHMTWDKFLARRDIVVRNIMANAQWVRRP